MAEAARRVDPVAGEVPALGSSADDLESALRASDATVLLVAHSGYELGHLARNSRRLLDVTGSVPGGEVMRH